MVSCDSRRSSKLGRSSRPVKIIILPADYNDKLIDEIKKRTQGPTETMGIYLAIMKNMFNRLTVPVTETPE